jgi:hypothetical protein
MTHDNARVDRRTLLQLGALAGLAAVGQASAQPAAPAPGRKFGPDGRVLPFAGNTIICHLPQQGSGAGCFEAMMDGYRAAIGDPALRKVTLLPPSSYHMTIFSGADYETRTRGDWPTYVPLDATMADCNAAVAERLKRLKLNLTLPIRMAVDPDQGALTGDTLQVAVVPVDAQEATRLADARAALATAFDLRNMRRGPYRFHISIGYLFRPMSPVEANAAQDVVVRWSKAMAARAPVIALGAPEFCGFDDMFLFRRLLFVS